MKILAIDLGQSKSKACVYEVGTDRHRFQTVATTAAELHDLIVLEEPDRVVIEVCSSSGWVCDLCRVLGVPIQTANPNHEAWRWRSVSHKSDERDALKLARLSAMNQLPTVHVPEPEVRAWRELIRFRQSLVGRRTAVKNSIRAILTRRGIKLPAEQRGWSKKQRERLKEMASTPDGAAWRAMLAVELEQLDSNEAALKRVEADLDRIASRDSRVELLQTIPGVGPRLAETVVAVIDDPHRFRSGREVGAYVGLAPRRMQSGSMDRQGRISRRGHTLLRSLLVEVAWVGRRWNPWMKQVYERALHGSPARKKIAIVAVARRLLVVCWAMLRDGTRWRPPVALKLAA